MEGNELAAYQSDSQGVRIQSFEYFLWILTWIATSTSNYKQLEHHHPI